MSILAVIVIVALIGVVLRLVNKHVQMQPPIPLILNLFVGFCVIVWLLHVCGLWHELALARIR